MMFRSSQLGYTRELLASLRSLMSGRGDRKRALKSLAIVGTVLPAAWTAAGLITKEIYQELIGAEDDDEDKALIDKYGEEFIANAVGSPFAGYPILGNISGSITNSFTRGHSYRRDPQFAPIMSTITDMNRLTQKARSENGMSDADYIKLTKMVSQFFGLPSAPLRVGADIIEANE